jgi:hypothetical protein
MQNRLEGRRSRKKLSFGAEKAFSFEEGAEKREEERKSVGESFSAVERLINWNRCADFSIPDGRLGCPKASFAVEVV